MALLEEIGAVLSSLSEEAIQAAVAKAQELSLDQNRGAFPLADALERARQQRDLLDGVLKDGRLEQVPDAILLGVLSRLRELQSQLTELSAGNDVIPALVDRIVSLDIHMWQSRITDLPREFHGLERVRKQATDLLKFSQSTSESLRLAIEERDALVSAVGELEKTRQDLEKRIAEANSSAETAAAKATEATASATSVLSSLGEANTHLSEISKQLASAQEQSGKVSALQASAQAFIDSVELFRKRMDETAQATQGAEAQRQEEFKELASRIQDLSVRADDVLQEATAGGLFHAFGKRKEEIAGPRAAWGRTFTYSVLFGILLLTLLGYEVATNRIELGAGFFLRLSAVPLIIYFIGFSAAQYGRERRLEEEYAFKSTISISLEAYRRMVESQLRPGDDQQRAKYTDFLIASMQGIFRSPREVDRPVREDGVLLEGKDLLGILKGVIKQ